MSIGSRVVRPLMHSGATFSVCSRKHKLFAQSQRRVWWGRLAHRHPCSVNVTRRNNPCMGSQVPAPVSDLRCAQYRKKCPALLTFLLAPIASILNRSGVVG